MPEQRIQNRGIRRRILADCQRGLPASRRNRDPLKRQQATRISAEHLKLDLPEINIPIRRHIPGERVVRVAGDRIAELGGGAFDEGDRSDDLGE